MRVWVVGLVVGNRVVALSNRFLLWRLGTETPAHEGACSKELLDYTYTTLERGAPSGNSFPWQRGAGSTHLHTLLAAATDDADLSCSSVPREAGAGGKALP